MLGFGSPRSWRLVAGVILLGVVGAIIAFRPSSRPRPSGASSRHSATTRPSTVRRPPPNSFQTARPRTSAGGGVDRIEGRSGREVWVVVPDRPVRSVVVFGHGWKLTPPSPAHSWVGQFRPWLDHLAADGSAVIFPRYQLGIGDTQDATRVLDFAHGLHTGYSLLGRPKVPIVAVGYSFGASLAFYYGANAAAWRLPLPTAVQASLPRRHDPRRAVTSTQPNSSRADSSRGRRRRGRQRWSQRILELARDAPEFAQAISAHPLLARTRRHPRRTQVTQCGCPTYLLGAS